MIGPDIGFLVERIGVAVFALSGALVAARKGMDPFGFALLATVTGVGGGSLRDVLLGRPAFWIQDPTDPVICVAVALALYFHGRRRGLAFFGGGGRILVWADAMGLAIFAVVGSATALAAGAPPITAVVLGTLTATFGGIIRDILAGDVPLVLHREIYVTAAFLGAAVHAGAVSAGLPGFIAGAAGIASAFVLRALAILKDWSLPPYVEGGR